MASWQTKSSKVVYENPWMIVHEDQVVTPSGKDGVYGYVESKSGSAYIVPVDDEGNTYLVQQERYTLGQTTWECVAGRIDEQSMEDGAKRELLEETGLQAKALTKIGETRPANGISKFKSNIYLARDLTKVSDDLDAEDGITAVQKVPLNEVSDKILAGEITCSDSVAALYMAMAYLEREKSL